jgi:folate-binding protein YgfZ
MKAALLPDRGVLRVSGDDARSFLNGLLTADIGKVLAGVARFAALLTPQGKILFDCIVTEAPAEDGGGFFLDCPRVLSKAFAERLGFYKLRAKVTVENRSDVLGVLAVWDGAATTEYGLVYPDPRLPALGLRVMLPPETTTEAAADLGATLTDAAAYESHRIALGVPRGGVDFIYGDAFPHDTDMDQLGGVDFDKGCYVGQEIVSRMEHRGTARSRVVSVVCDSGAPEAGAPVMAGDKQIGTMGSSAHFRGVALLRLDRAEDAIKAGIPLITGGVPIQILKQDWMKFPVPGEKAAAQ